MARSIFSGPTLEDALAAAAQQHNCDPDRIAFQKVEKKRGARKSSGVVIKVDPESPQLAEGVTQEAAEVPAEAPAPVEETPVEVPPPAEPEVAVAATDDVESEPEAEEDESPFEEATEEAAVEESTPEPAAAKAPREGRAAANEDVDRSAKKWLEAILELSQMDLDFEIFQGEERLEVDLEGPDEGIVVEDEAQVLRSIQHLLPRLMHSDISELLHCRVDCDGYQDDREEDLRRMAFRIAEDVRSRGRSKTLRPMHPADRRVVHLALADDPDVETESVGSGYFKRVQIREM